MSFPTPECPWWDPTHQNLHLKGTVSREFIRTLYPAPACPGEIHSPGSPPARDSLARINMTQSSAQACRWWKTHTPGSPSEKDNLTRIHETLSSAPACPWWGTRTPGSLPKRGSLTRIYREPSLAPESRIRGMDPTHHDL